MRPETPAGTQRRNRLKTLPHLPDRSGRPRQGVPVRIRQSAASTESLLSAAVTPGPVALPGSMRPVRARMASARTVLPSFISVTCPFCLKLPAPPFRRSLAHLMAWIRPDCQQALAHGDGT